MLITRTNKISCRLILVLSLTFHLLLTLPLALFAAIDGTIQQQIYMHLSAHLGKHDIAFIGDSITAGGYVWANKIGAYNFNIWNYGKGGFKTDQISFYAKKVAQEKFKLCFIMSGINDELTNYDQVLKTYNNYIAILQTLQKSNVEPVVTLTLYREHEKYKEFIDRLNMMISDYCTHNNIKIIDLRKSLCDETGLKKEFSYDGTHLKRRAYTIWGSEINKILHEDRYL